MTTSLRAGHLRVGRKQKTLGGVALRRTLEEQNKLHEPCVGYWHYQRRYSCEQYFKKRKGRARMRELESEKERTTAREMKRSGEKIV
jgi:hypothetical protein